MRRALRGAGMKTVMAAVGFLWLLPTLGLLLTALRPRAEISRSGWWNLILRPSQVTLENFERILESRFFVRSLVNTFAITVPSTVGVVLVASMAAYALAWIEFPGRDWMFVAVIGLLVVPLQMALIPVARLYGTIGIFGSILGAILFHVAFGLPFAIFLLRNFFAGIPKELLEAARLDGASEARIFVRVILPLGVPAIASLAIFQFLWVWNDLLVALVFTRTASAPITVAIQQQLRSLGGNIDIIAAASFISMVVPLIVFFSFQRYFAEGLLAGSVK
ncbi:MAG TPA: carbohydrate ABC transporter permease [Actinomycetota bacterium]|jgi:alpha-glucoside transport system permease protein|nr:carbohydrate ABC transporter permease [Actinomycetota bacterium]